MMSYRYLISIDFLPSHVEIILGYDEIKLVLTDGEITLTLNHLY